MAFSEQGRKVSKNGEWNKLRIVANGPDDQDLAERRAARGNLRRRHAARRDRAASSRRRQGREKVGLKVHFRNIRIHELEPNTLTEQEKADGWKLLWDGKTTDGWRSPKSETFPDEELAH